MYLLSMEKSTAGNAIYSIRLPSCNVIRWLITNILSIFQKKPSFIDTNCIIFNNEKYIG